MQRQVFLSLPSSLPPSPSPCTSASLNPSFIYVYTLGTPSDTLLMHRIDATWGFQKVFDRFASMWAKNVSKRKIQAWIKRDVNVCALDADQWTPFISLIKNKNKKKIMNFVPLRPVNLFKCIDNLFKNSLILLPRVVAVAQHFFSCT